MRSFFVFLGVRIIHLVNILPGSISLTGLFLVQLVQQAFDAVRAFRDAFPEAKILADTKIMDGGHLESTLMFAAGADYVTVLGVADPATLAACVDAARAGVGDRVLVLDEGNGARQVLGMKTAPIRAVVVGVIDEVALAE